MTKREIREKPIEALIKAYPIVGRLPNWYFRVVEVSNNAWRAEGRDLWGRKVSRMGGDPEALLEACIADAQSILASSQ